MPFHDPDLTQSCLSHVFVESRNPPTSRKTWWLIELKISEPFSPCMLLSNRCESATLGDRCNIANSRPSPSLFPLNLHSLFSLRSCVLSLSLSLSPSIRQFCFPSCLVLSLLPRSSAMSLSHTHSLSLPLSVFLSLSPSLCRSRSRSIDRSRSQSHFFSLPPVLLIRCSRTLSFHPLSLTTFCPVPFSISLISLSISLPHDLFFSLSL